MGRLRVATVITRMSAGAGGVALRGALALDPDRYDVTVVAGGTGLDGRAVSRGAPLLTGPDAVAELPLGDLLGAAYGAGLSVVRVPDLVPQIAPARDLAALRTLARLFAEGGYDVVHTHTSKAGALGRYAAARTGAAVRIVHTFHGLPFHDFQAPWRRAVYLSIERRLGRRTDAFLAVGGAVAAEAVRRGLAPPDRIRAISPAVDRIGHRLAPGLARHRLGLPLGVRLVGTVGRIDHQKAPEDWVDAVAAAGDDVWGAWIGDGPLRDRLLARVRSRLAGRFRWLGHRTDVGQVLPAFDAFALASRYEGLPCAVVEAMQAGVPVAATAVNAVPELVVPGDTGMLAPAGQPALLGRAIGHLLDSPAEARRMAATAAVRLGDRFSPETLGAVLDQTYRGVPAGGVAAQIASARKSANEN